MSELDIGSDYSMDTEFNDVVEALEVDEMKLFTNLTVSVVKNVQKVEIIFEREFRRQHGRTSNYLQLVKTVILTPANLSDIDIQINETIIDELCKACFNS
ncbi:unnamed protein product [Caenorhabditis bovis]|uniref:Uncharacterized protein n=1 Tax=Caenorhabditis bovis TaxID=2654633 RepID=A0A8S1FEL7_9PELO|nr:unnamed protein product [Caenorhabditis bovis]